jgi:hypothetical protein
MDSPARAGYLFLEFPAGFKAQIYVGKSGVILKNKQQNARRDGLFLQAQKMASLFKPNRRGLPWIQPRHVIPLGIVIQCHLSVFRVFRYPVPPGVIRY